MQSTEKTWSAYGYVQALISQISSPIQTRHLLSSDLNSVLPTDEAKSRDQDEAVLADSIDFDQQPIFAGSYVLRHFSVDATETLKKKFESQNQSIGKDETLVLVSTQGDAGEQAIAVAIVNLDQVKSGDLDTFRYALFEIGIETPVTEVDVLEGLGKGKSPIQTKSVVDVNIEDQKIFVFLPLDGTETRAVQTLIETEYKDYFTQFQNEQLNKRKHYEAVYVTGNELPTQAQRLDTVDAEGNITFIAMDKNSKQPATFVELANSDYGPDDLNTEDQSKKSSALDEVVSVLTSKSGKTLLVGEETGYLLAASIEVGLDIESLSPSKKSVARVREYIEPVLESVGKEQVDANAASDKPIPDFEGRKAWEAKFIAKQGDLLTTDSAKGPYAQVVLPFVEDKLNASELKTSLASARELLADDGKLVMFSQVNRDKNFDSMYTKRDEAEIRKVLEDAGFDANNIFIAYNEGPNYSHRVIEVYLKPTRADRNRQTERLQSKNAAEAMAERYQAPPEPLSSQKIEDETKGEEGFDKSELSEAIKAAAGETIPPSRTFGSENESADADAAKPEGASGSGSPDVQGEPKPDDNKVTTPAVNAVGDDDDDEEEEISISPAVRFQQWNQAKNNAAPKKPEELIDQDFVDILLSAVALLKDVPKGFEAVDIYDSTINLIRSKLGPRINSKILINENVLKALNEFKEISSNEPYAQLKESNAKSRNQKLTQFIKQVKNNIKDNSARLAAVPLKVAIGVLGSSQGIDAKLIAQKYPDQKIVPLKSENYENELFIAANQFDAVIPILIDLRTLEIGTRPDDIFNKIDRALEQADVQQLAEMVIQHFESIPNQEDSLALAQLLTHNDLRVLSSMITDTLGDLQPIASRIDLNQDDTSPGMTSPRIELMIRLLKQLLPSIETLSGTPLNTQAQGVGTYEQLLSIQQEAASAELLQRYRDNEVIKPGDYSIVYDVRGMDVAKLPDIVKAFNSIKAKAAEFAEQDVIIQLRLIASPNAQSLFDSLSASDIDFVDDAIGITGLNVTLNSNTVYVTSENRSQDVRDYLGAIGEDKANTLIAGVDVNSQAAFVTTLAILVEKDRLSNNAGGQNPLLVLADAESSQSIFEDDEALNGKIHLIMINLQQLANFIAARMAGILASAFSA